MTEIIIREYKPEDRPVLEECILELQGNEYELRPHTWVNPTPDMAREYLDYTLKSVLALPDAKIFIGELEGVTAGWIVVTMATEDGPDIALKRYGYIPELAVLSQYRGKGIGRALMDKAEEFVRSQGGEFIKLEVSKGNDAEEFYSKIGYKTTTSKMEKKLI